MTRYAWLPEAHDAPQRILKDVRVHPRQPHETLPETAAGSESHRLIVDGLYAAWLKPHSLLRYREGSPY
jgi:hypothetical protein